MLDNIPPRGIEGKAALPFRTRCTSRTATLRELLHVWRELSCQGVTAAGLSVATRALASTCVLCRIMSI